MSKFRDQLPPLHVIYEWNFCHGSNDGINRNTVYDKTGQHYFKIQDCDFGSKKLIQNFNYLHYSTTDNPNYEYGDDWISVSTHDNVVTGNISSIQFFRWLEDASTNIYINKDWYIKITGASIKRVCTYGYIPENTNEADQIPFEYLNNGIWHISPHDRDPSKVAIILENQTQDTIYIQEVGGELSEDCEFNGWLDSGGLKLNDAGYMNGSRSIKRFGYSSVAMIRSNNLISASDSYANARIRTFGNINNNMFLFEGYLSTTNQYCISEASTYFSTEDSINSYIIPQSDYFTCFFNNKYNDQDISVDFPWGNQLMDITLFWRAPTVTIYSFVYTNSGGSESFYDKLRQYMLNKYNKYINY